MTKYTSGDLVVIRGRALSKDDNAFAIGVIIEDSTKKYIEEYDDMWNTKEVIWEKMYKVLTQGKIINVSYCDIKGNAE
jgi:hypothetical protein|tara:strand:+ start:15601 stop:15834 length:234 start_codon:yes stop_codon:yes gene_type:complete